MGAKRKNKKLISIVGPTAVGKTDLSIKVALWLSSKKAKEKFKINGAEIVSADSRQVYKDMDIGTGKITNQEMQNIPHHLLDIASPTEQFTVAKYKRLALQAINKIFSKNKIPILVGGTGFYIQAVVKDLKIPKVKPDWELRKKLSKKSKKELFKILKQKDPRRSKNIDPHNKRRLVRALEIIEKTDQPVPPLQKDQSKFNTIMVGIKKPRQELKKRIEKRLKKRLNQGMIEEVKKLHQSGVSWERLESFGLEYRYVAYYLQNKMNYEGMVQKLQKEIEHFAKRQMTWFKKNKNIHWIKNYKEAKNLIKEFLTNFWS